MAGQYSRTSAAVVKLNSAIECTSELSLLSTSTSTSNNTRSHSRALALLIITKVGDIIATVISEVFGGD